MYLKVVEDRIVVPYRCHTVFRICHIVFFFWIDVVSVCVSTI